MGAWIEIGYVFNRRWFQNVAPHKGAWIEIVSYLVLYISANVAPHIGAWIEIVPNLYQNGLNMSHPHRCAN